MKINDKTIEKKSLNEIAVKHKASKVLGHLMRTKLKSNLKK
jgi:hypothetical protein